MRIIEFNKLKIYEKNISTSNNNIFKNKKINDPKSNIAFIKANKEYYFYETKKLHEIKDIDVNVSHIFQSTSKNNDETNNYSSNHKEVKLEELMSKDYLKSVICLFI